MKKTQIKKLLVEYLEEKKVLMTVNQTDLDNLVEELSELSYVNKDILLKYIGKISYIIKESVDFSDTNYLLAQIVTIINAK